MHLKRSSIIENDFKDFGKDMIQISQKDSVNFLVSQVIKPHGVRTSAVDAFFLNSLGNKVWLRAEVNYKYDPSRSPIGNAIEAGDSILFPFSNDTLLLKKHNGEKLFYRIIYPDS